MGYFPNATAHDFYSAEYCDHCRHCDPENGGCAIMDVHMMFNYEQIGNDKLRAVLSTLIPEEGIENKQCAMFMPMDPNRCRETPDMFTTEAAQ